MNKLNIKFKSYQLIQRAVEEGIICGYKKAHKHTDDPGEDAINETILNYVMNELSEIIDFDEND